MVRSMDFGQRAEAVVRAEESSESPGSLPAKPRGRRLQQRLPCGYVVGQPGDGLQLVGFQSRAGNLRLGCQLRGVEEPAAGDGDLLLQQQAELRR